MNHADPWDEMVRLEKQMEVELLAALARTRTKQRKDVPVNERLPSAHGRLEPRP